MLMKINLSVSSDMVDGYVVCEREASTSRSPGLGRLPRAGGVSRCQGVLAAGPLHGRDSWQAVDNAVRLCLDGAGCPRLHLER